MSEKLVQLFKADVTQLAGAQLEAWKLFLLIKQHHSEKEAREIFFEWGKPPSKTRINELKNWALLQRYDSMEKPNVAELARQIVEENSHLAEDQQLTPRYRPTLPTVDKHLRNLLRERQEGLQAGTWEGPTSMRRFNREWDEWIKLETGSS
ncbi:MULTISPECIES: hypothetical protein [unclassified Bradyrhizobium]|uniref:hypothetical protein n=1 Tax=unclassified Bradyrhizobium TaxID=2631580 RepID=UPI001FFB4E64|nr:MULTISPECIES: hypothetical protein [unclassified Bradyrhizobium]MCK1707618.1 hypothetical protein [Bradyrhizobium sp. 143]MCK1724829.1 hypothetical protein [Bradyrhizobium sp. 142]